MHTQIRSQPMRTNRKGHFLFLAMTMGMASYTETPRLEVMYREEAKHITSTPMARKKRCAWAGWDRDRRS